MTKIKHSTISIPKVLHKKIRKRIEGTGFTSVSSYVTFILREIMSSLEHDEKNAFTKDDEKRVKKRLKALGYI